MIDIKDILTLDDNNRYVVVSKINYNDKIYYYLVNMNSNNKDKFSYDNNVKFCYDNNTELIQIQDKSVIMKLLPLFIEKAKENLNIN